MDEFVVPAPYHSPQAIPLVEGIVGIVKEKRRPLQPRIPFQHRNQTYSIKRSSRLWFQSRYFEQGREGIRRDDGRIGT